jgi:hypothetical protein
VIPRTTLNERVTRWTIAAVFLLIGALLHWAFTI